MNLGLKLRLAGILVSGHRWSTSLPPNQPVFAAGLNERFEKASIACGLAHGNNDL
jgi:hypothetical protein